MITVLYSCAGCGIKERALQVPARVGFTADDVVPWMQTVAQCVSDDHRTVSPKCKATSMTELKIPMPSEAEFIGQQIE